MVIDGEWRLSFEEGYPQIPAPVTMRELHSWTELPDTAATYFCGTALYEILFDLPQFMQKKERYLLDLGDVREAAEVFLNDKYVGKCWSLPFEINIDPLLLKTNKNKLTIKVRNLDANRIRWMDINHVPWKNFFFVDVAYNSFDASQWEPVPSGLLGKIRLKSD